MYVQFARAAQIAGISENQLKEWCTRRKLISPDVAPQGRGHNALFAWQTLLVLRLLATLHRDFGGTVAHWAPILQTWRLSLEGRSFPTLFGLVVVSDGARIQIAASAGGRVLDALLVLPLDPHLDAIAASLRDDGRDLQLPLFPPLLVKR